MTSMVVANTGGTCHARVPTDNAVLSKTELPEYFSLVEDGSAINQLMLSLC